MDRELNDRGVLNQLRKLTFPGRCTNCREGRGRHGKGNKGLVPPPLKDRDIYLVARLKRLKRGAPRGRMPDMASVLILLLIAMRPDVLTRWGSGMEEAWLMVIVV